MMVELRSEGIDLPNKVGFYEAVDEEPKTLGQKIGRKTINPEHDFGMRKADGERKMILQGSPHVLCQISNQKVIILNLKISSTICEHQCEKQRINLRTKKVIIYAKLV